MTTEDQEKKSSRKPLAFLRVSRFPFNCPISFSTDDILSRDEESIENIELAKEQTQKSNRAIFSLPLITFLVNAKKQKRKKKV